MTTIHVYCDHFGSEGSEDDMTFIKAVTEAGAGRHGFVQSGEPMEIDDLVGTFMEGEDRSSVRDEFMASVSGLLCGEGMSVFNGETDNFLFTLEDKGDRLEVDHQAMFTHFQTRDHETNTIPYLNTPLEKAVDRSGISFLVSREEGGYRYDAYGHKDGFVRLGSTVLSERLPSPVIYDVLAHMAENELLVDEIAEVMGEDWRSLATPRPQATSAPSL